MKGTTTNHIIISDLPDDVIAALDAIAERVAMTREDFISAVLHREARRTVSLATVAELEQLGQRLREHHGDPDAKDASQ